MNESFYEHAAKVWRRVAIFTLVALCFEAWVAVELVTSISQKLEETQHKAYDKPKR